MDYCDECCAFQPKLNGHETYCKFYADFDILFPTERKGQR